MGNMQRFVSNHRGELERFSNGGALYLSLPLLSYISPLFSLTRPPFFLILSPSLNIKDMEGKTGSEGRKWGENRGRGRGKRDGGEEERIRKG